MNMKRYLCTGLLLLLAASACFAQGERKSVRRGNRDFRKEAWQQAEINYKKALVSDSTSVAAGYNLGNTYFRQENFGEADRYYKAAIDSLAKGKYGADAFHNMGNSLLKQRNWQGAIDAYKNALRRNPGDMETKSNLAYAQKMLENEQQNGGGQNDQNQDQNQDQDQNNDQNQDQQQNQDQNQNNDQNQNQDQQQDQKQNQDQQRNQGQQPKITPQAAQQMLQAIQAQENDTQDKVKKEKAARLKSKQKEKNW